jgi:ApaG protein
MYQAVTRKIEVSVTPRFMPERSSAEKNYFFWSYTIEITNRGDEAVQLKTRPWTLPEAVGRVPQSGDAFDIAVPAFSLDSTEDRRTLN